MPNFLSSKVSLFRNAKSTKPIKNIPIADFLVGKEYSDKYSKLIADIRSCEDKRRRNELKKNLPAITPSGIFSMRNDSGLNKHNGLICIDIDKKDNSISGNELKSAVADFPFVSYCALSASGDGCFALVPISAPKCHLLHFEQLIDDFLMCGINIDRSCGNLSRLRFYSYDDAPYINERADIYSGRKELGHIEKPRSALINRDPNSHSYKDFVKFLLEIEKRQIDITANYKDWLTICRAIASNFGELGRNHFHRISSFYHDYKYEECDKLYDSCLTGKTGHIKTIAKIANKYERILMIMYQRIICKSG